MGLSAVKLMQVRMPKQSKLSYKIDGHCINVKSPAYILLTNEIQFFSCPFFLFRNSLIKMNVICVIILYFEIVEKEQKKQHLNNYIKCHTSVSSCDII